MAFSFAAATSIVANQGKGVTYGKNKHGGVILILPGRLTLDEVRAQQSDESVKSYGTVVSVEVK